MSRYQSMIKIIMKWARINALILASAIVGQSGSLTVNNEGVQEAIINDYDTSYIEYNVQPTNTEAVQPRAIVPLPPRASASLEYSYSDNFKVLNIPVGYKIKDWLFFKARIPYIQRTVKIGDKSYSASGIGDIYVGFDVIEKRKETFATATTIATSLPTGDNEKTDDGVLVPLGKDAYNMHVGQYFSWVAWDFSFSAFVGLKYYLTDNEFTYQGQEYKEEVGTKLYLNFGIDKNVKDYIRMGAKLTYFQNEESKMKVNGFEAGMNDDLKVADLILYVVPSKIRYRNLGAQISVVVPVYTDYNDEVRDEPDRKMSVSVRITKLF